MLLWPWYIKSDLSTHLSPHIHTYTHTFSMVGSSILTFGLVATAVVANPLSYTNRNPNAYRNPYFRSLVSRDDLPAGATNNWKLDTEFKGENWYGGWTFETYPGGEPTQGRTK